MNSMKKRVLSFFIVILLMLCQISVSAETLDNIAEWDTFNTVTLEIKSDYVDEILEDVSGAFDSLDLKNAYIFNKNEYEGKNLHLILVLNEGGDTHQEAAIAILKNDSRIKNVYKSCDAYFETVNTLKLIADSAVIKQGETTVIRPEGELKIWQRPFSYDEISVGLKNYDPEKEYTLSDFPHFDFASMEKTEFVNIGKASFSLKLAEPSYFNVYKAINVLALDPDVEYVQPNYFGYPDVVYPSEWKISDDSIIDFVNKEPCTWDGDGNIIEYRAIPNENDEIVVKGLKPGKTTLTYMGSFGHWVAKDYPVSIEITVGDGIDNPKTGDGGNSFVLTVTLFMLSFLVIFMFRSKKKEII